MRISPIDDVRQMYDEMADFYNQIMDEDIKLSMYAEWLGSLADLIAEVEGPILDAACGPGHIIEKLQSDYAPERQLMGIDISPGMVAIARKKFAESAHIIEGDMCTLEDFSERSFAAVINTLALHHCDGECMRRCFSEWFRVLKPGGALLATTWEGEGIITYGENLNVLAVRHRAQEITQTAEQAGFKVNKCTIHPVESMQMDVVALLALKE